MNMYFLIINKFFYAYLLTTTIFIGPTFTALAMDQQPPIVQQFFDAAIHDNPEKIRDLLLTHKVNINTQDSAGKTALSWAAYNKDNKALQELLRHHPDINLANKHLWTPLKKAASSGNEGAVRLLIDAGADVNRADDEGYTPLMNAHENYTITQMLIKAGAQVNHQAFKDGTTALMWATIASQMHVMTLLIDAGAQDTLLNKRQENARIIAAKKSDHRVLELLEERFGKIHIFK